LFESKNFLDKRSTEVAPKFSKEMRAQFEELEKTRSKMVQSLNRRRTFQDPKSSSMLEGFDSRFTLVKSDPFNNIGRSNSVPSSSSSSFTDKIAFSEDLPQNSSVQNNSRLSLTSSNTNPMNDSEYEQVFVDLSGIESNARVSMSSKRDTVSQSVKDPSELSSFRFSESSPDRIQSVPPESVNARKSGSLGSSNQIVDAVEFPKRGISKEDLRILRDKKNKVVEKIDKMWLSPPNKDALRPMVQNDIKEGLETLKTHSKDLEWQIIKRKKMIDENRIVKINQPDEITLMNQIIEKNEKNIELLRKKLETNKAYENVLEKKKGLLIQKKDLDLMLNRIELEKEFKKSNKEILQLEAQLMEMVEKRGGINTKILTLEVVPSLKRRNSLSPSSGEQIPQVVDEMDRSSTVAGSDLYGKQNKLISSLKDIDRNILEKTNNVNAIKKEIDTLKGNIQMGQENIKRVEGQIEQIKKSIETFDKSPQWTQENTLVQNQRILLDELIQKYNEKIAKAGKDIETATSTLTIKQDAMMKAKAALKELSEKREVF
jgi:hypothetical protein